MLGLWPDRIVDIQIPDSTEPKMNGWGLYGIFNFEKNCYEGIFSSKNDGNNGTFIVRKNSIDPTDNIVCFAFLKEGKEEFEDFCVVDDFNKLKLRIYLFLFF